MPLGLAGPEHILVTGLTLERSRPEVFEFFARPENLERITPPELSFRILTPRPIAMHAGARIEYRLALHGLPMRWRTRISAWSPPDMFVDEQEQGPYAQWIHTHHLTDTPGGGTRVEDEVRYRLPFAPLGELAHGVVRGRLARIFAHRQGAVSEVFGGGRESIVRFVR